MDLSRLDSWIEANSVFDRYYQHERPHVYLRRMNPTPGQGASIDLIGIKPAESVEALAAVKAIIDKHGLKFRIEKIVYALLSPHQKELINSWDDVEVFDTVERI